MKILITGIGGFVGKHLYQELLSHGHTVNGASREPEAPKELTRLGHYQSLDLTTDSPNIEGVDSIIHLAGMASVGPSFDNPQTYINTNSAMLTNICESLLKKDFTGRLIVVSSGAVYSPNQPMPLNESSAVSVSSPYVISKLLVENQSEYYRSRGLDIVVARPFNHIGPGQAPGFIVPDIINKLQNLNNGRVVRVGNLSTKRDYTDVRDVVRAYRMLVEAISLNHCLYNICSGISRSGQEILESIVKAMCIDDINVEIDTNLVRPNDAQEIYGDYSLIEADTSWEPKINLAQTLKDSILSISSNSYLE